MNSHQTSPQAMGEPRTALLLVRTPLQAWLAEQVVQREAVSRFDLLYFTHDNSSEDRTYFQRLAALARQARYCHAPRRRFDILGQLDFAWQTRHWRRSRGYDLTLMASINAPVINAIANRQIGAELITFDDGLSNILPTGMYQIADNGWRARLYRRLLGAADLAQTKARIRHHYTVLPQFDNIVPASGLRPLAGWKSGSSSIDTTGREMTYFIGQPLDEALTPEQINVLVRKLKGMRVDFYVRHPRERRLLDIGAPCLDKAGLIAEDAITRHAGNLAIHVIGWFSTVLFNLGAVAHKRTILLLADGDDTERMVSLAKQAGCDVVLL